MPMLAEIFLQYSVSEPQRKAITRLIMVTGLKTAPRAIVEYQNHLTSCTTVWLESASKGCIVSSLLSTPFKVTKERHKR